ncbi:synaptic vesicle 2-related protein-like isoform X2 [Lineus longissimus]|uniref:synaptic vesicle 2-related protein-like isoform X2 n=1 Tax=Lineus longissimus TaxID=88925 RepID=UPI002B4F9738
MLNRLVKFRRGQGDSYEDLKGADVSPTTESGASASGGVEINPDLQHPQIGDGKGFSEEVFTVDQAVDRIGFGIFQVKLSFLTGLSWMADAMEMMILSILSPALHCAWRLEGWKQALTTTVVFCGMMLSSSIWGSICDKFGRRTALLLCSLFTFYYGILSALSPIFIWLLILRGLVGFGIGGAPQSVTLYAEFLPSSVRAKCVVLIEWLPESARYDMTRGNTEKAYATLQRIAKENNKPMPTGRLVHSTTNIKQTQVKRGQIKDLFTPEFRRTTFLLWFIWLACAFSYYGIVLMTTELFEVGDSCHGGTGAGETGEPICPAECKMLTTKDYTDLLWTSIAEFPGLFITAAVIERLGRKKTMAMEFVVFSFFTLLVNMCTSRALLTFFLFVARAFISGAFQAAYVYTPEVYPTSTRAIGLGSCSGMARIGAIVTPFVAQVMLRRSVYLSISIYGTLTLLAAVAALFLPIETKGREMVDISATATKEQLERK